VGVKRPGHDGDSRVGSQSILVAFQIKQNTEITRAQVANDWFLADMQLELAMMGENPAESWTKAVYEPDELNQKDTAVLDRYFNYGLVQLQRLQRMNDLGYLTWHLGNDVGRRWWSHFKGSFPPEFAATVDEILKNADLDENRSLLDALVTPQPPAT
jgi:hypothetical protein